MRIFKKIKKTLSSKKIGLSLIEVIVAIAISGMTLTVSAVFSTRVMIYAQENFMQDSSNQLNALISEQLKFIELDLTEAKLSNGSITPKIQNELWGQICNLKGNYTDIRHFNISIPSYDSSSMNFVFSQSTNTLSTINGYEGSFKFNPLTQNQLMGSFLEQKLTTSSNNPRVSYAVRVYGNQETLTFESIVRYYVLNQSDPKYTDLIKIVSYKGIICR